MKMRRTQVSRDYSQEQQIRTAITEMIRAAGPGYDAEGVLFGVFVAFRFEVKLRKIESVWAGMVRGRRMV